MLFGEFNHTLDDKNRLSIPSKLRNELGDNNVLFVLRGFDGCLALYTKEHFDKLIETLSQYSFLSSDARNLQRATLASVNQLNIDKVNRIQFTPSLLEKYGIGKDVTVIGVGDHIEVWDKKAYTEYENNTLSKYEEIADKLVK